MVSELSDDPTTDVIDFAARELCPDGACIGIIGPDGRCRECHLAGRRAVLDPRRAGLRSTGEVQAELEANIIVHDLAAPPDDFDDRQLCPDGACIGVLGADGRCSACGRTASAATSP